MHDAGRRLSQGDFSARVGPALGRRRDEIAEFSATFDQMAERIESLVRAHKDLLRDVSHELRSPLARAHAALSLARQRPNEAVDDHLERVEAEIDNGGEISIATGRLMPNGWHLEAELGFLNLETDSVVVSGLDARVDDSFRLDGSVDSTVLMFNTLIDLNMNSQRFTPYLKAGIGLARKEAQATLDIEYDSAIWHGTSLEGQSDGNREIARCRIFR